MINIDFTVNGGAWCHNDQACITTAINETLAHVAYQNDTEISVLLTDDAQMQALNHNYRDKDKPTNVLSFPQNEPAMLGDIVIAHETLIREAKNQHKAYEHHLTHLTIHSVLHLLGHDHEDDEEAEKMESLDIQILKKMGIKNPYDDESFEV